MSTPPRGLMLEHRIEDRHQLAHTRGQGHLGRFARGAEPLIERLEDRVVTYRNQGTHEQRRTDLRSPTPDRPFPSEGATIPVERGDADQGRDLFAIQRAQF